jgi:hypothetical protein
MRDERLLNCAEQGASPKVIHNLIHRLSTGQTGLGVGGFPARRERVPGVVELCRGMYCVPAINISTKVRSGI